MRAQVALAAFAVALVAVWLAVDPRTPDLAAQVYRVELFRESGWAIWDARWYAGHALPGYSLLFPPLGALLGVRGVGAVSVLLSTLLFGRLAASLYNVRAARWATAWFALAALGDVWAGRVAFALGVWIALTAVLALRRGWTAWAALLGALCAAASPVAGALLALAAVSASVTSRSPRAALALGVPALALVLALAALFPEGGYEPFPVLSFAATAAVVGAFLLALPARERGLRAGAWLYLGVCVACLLVHSPVGSNVERYGVLLAGPLLLCAWLGASAAGERRGGPRGTTALALALCAAAVWVAWGPVRETEAVAGSAATSASYYAPLERFLASATGGAPVRVEVPLTRSHWEAALLAPSVSLARGWEKQLDSRYDQVLLTPGLTAASYARWLRAEAVAYVALPDVALDPSSAQEGRVIGARLAYLAPVFASAHWRVFAVRGATPLLSGAPARLLSVGHDSLRLRADAVGTVTVRVRYTRYWTVSDGVGCVARAPGGWTLVRVKARGTLVVSARFSLARALGLGGACS